MNKSKRKHLGDTSFYCPVILKEKGVLWPGNPEISAKFREKVYYLSSYEARERFVHEPAKYVSKDLLPVKSPCTRLLIVGPRGSGKTSHGKYIAEKLGLFHIAFRERLQELIMPKLKRRLGPECKEGHEFEIEMRRMNEQEKQRVALEEIADAGLFFLFHFSHFTGSALSCP